MSEQPLDLPGAANRNSMSQEAVEEGHPGLGAARRRCHGARDAFYACVDGVTAKGEEPWTRERPVPAPCLALRGAFEAGCRTTWVKVSRREPRAGGG